jgi:hypothetical protein
MYFLDKVHHISPEVTVKGFKKCCISSGMEESDDDVLWNGSNSMGLLGVSVRQMKALTVKMETVTLIGKSRLNLTRFVYKAYAIYSIHFSF